MTFDSKLIEKFIKTFDKMLSEEGWDKSFLLQVSKKRLLKARDALEKSLQKEESSIDAGINQEALVPVYLSLYHSGGASLFFWENMLKVLSSCSLGRPIYRNEADVIKAISSRADLKNEAYVEILVEESKIIIMPNEKKSLDINGVELLTMQPGAVNQANVKRFVHANKDTYVWEKNRLRLKD